MLLMFVYIMIYYDMVERIVYQGTLVRVHGIGVLIEGQSGVGKSLAALSLMRSGHRLIADDLVAITKKGPGKLIGHPLEENVRIEVRGLGVFNAEVLFKDGVAASCQIDILVELTSYITERDAGRIDPLITKKCIMDCFFEKILVPTPSGVDPGLLIELIVRAHRCWRKCE